MAPATQPTAAPADSTVELVADPFVISARIRRLDEELRLARRLYALSVRIRTSSAEDESRDEGATSVR